MKNKVKALIKNHPEIVDFGSKDDAVSSDWIKKAEEYLDFKFPESYIWFLENYTGGEIAGEEIFSIYGMEFKNIYGGDIIFQHIMNQKNKILEPHQLAIEHNDYGELFFFDCTKLDIKNEYPIICRLPSGQEELYANDFYEFLYKRIMNICK